MPAVLTIHEACAMLKISKWTLYRLIHARQLKTIKIGSRRVVPVESVRLLIDRLSEDNA
ncbi:helix-turn-helix domain-containing protein [Micromonospora sp. Llam7]|uniref:helix-turn-helix domain-containing protein n=1 Tax=Micromonospora tarapacensis TaxID=2835305 RepID=UPI001C82CEC1|nr:helix-turn-helix domain-containing protein [Micromonospora tarapacensis]